MDDQSAKPHRKLRIVQAIIAILTAVAGLIVSLLAFYVTLLELSPRSEDQRSAGTLLAVAAYCCSVASVAVLLFLFTKEPVRRLVLKLRPDLIYALAGVLCAVAAISLGVGSPGEFTASLAGVYVVLAVLAYGLRRLTLRLPPPST